MSHSESVTASRKLWLVKGLLALAVLGIALRLVMSWYAIGSNDAVAWEMIAHDMENNGWLNVYQPDASKRSYTLNHPFIPAVMAWLALKASQASGLSFYSVFRGYGIAADIATCLLLWKIARRRGGVPAGATAAAVYAWSLNAMLVSGYHGNTDAILAFLVLLAATLVAEKSRVGLAGLALALAINIKLIPTVLIVPFLALCPTHAAARRMLAGLAIGALPFLIPLFVVPEGFYLSVIGYNSRLDLWGLGLLYEWGQPYMSADMQAWFVSYIAHCRYFILGVSCLLALVVWGYRLWNAYEVAVMGLAIFLLLTPVFGVQYMVVILPVLYAANLRVGLVYGLSSGIFMAISYAAFWTGTLPVYSHFYGEIGRLPMQGAWFGLVAWVLLLGYVVALLARLRRG